MLELLLEEKESLTKYIKRLETDSSPDNIENVSAGDQVAMTTQLSAMKVYLLILDSRIELASAKK